MCGAPPVNPGCTSLTMDESTPWSSALLICAFRRAMRRGKDSLSSLGSRVNKSRGLMREAGAESTRARGGSAPSGHGAVETAAAAGDEATSMVEAGQTERPCRTENSEGTVEEAAEVAMRSVILAVDKDNKTDGTISKAWRLVAQGRKVSTKKNRPLATQALTEAGMAHFVGGSLRSPCAC